MPRFLKVLFTLVGVALAVPLMVGLPRTQRAVRGALQERLAAATGGEARIGQVRTNLWNKVEIRDLRLHLPGARGGQVAVARVLVGFSPWRLVLGQRSADRVFVDSLALELGRAPSAAPAARDSVADPAGLPLPALAEWLPAQTRLTGLTVRGPAAPPADAPLSSDADTPSVGTASVARGPVLQATGALVLREAGASGDTSRLFELQSHDLRARWDGQAEVACQVSAILHLSSHSVAVRQLAASAGVNRVTLTGRLDTVLDAAAQLDLSLPALWRAARSPHQPETGQPQTAQAEAAPIQGAAIARLAVSGPLDHLEAGVHLDLANAALRGVPLSGASASLTWRDGVLGLDSLAVDVGQGRLVGRGRFDTSRPRASGHLEVELTGADAATLERLLTGAAGTSVGTSAGAVSGALRLERGPAPAAGLQVEADLAGRDLRLRDLPLGQWRLHGTYADSALAVFLVSDALRLAAEGRVRSLDDHHVRWRADLGDEAGLRRITGIDVGGRGGLTAITRGSLVRPEVRLTGEVDRPRVGPVGLDGLSLEAQLDSLGRFAATVQDRGGNVRLRLRGDLGVGRLDEGRLIATGLRLPQVLRTGDAPLWRGEITADLNFSGAPSSPTVAGTVLIDGLGYSHQDFGRAVGSVSLAGSAARARCALMDSALLAAAQVDLVKGGPFSVEARARDVDLTPLLALAAAERPGVGGILSGSAVARGRMGSPDSLVVEALLSEAEVHTRRASMHLAAPAHLAVSRGVVQVERFLLVGSGGRLAAQGVAAREGEIDMQVSLDSTRLAFVEPFLFDRDLGLDGAVSAGLTVSGASDNPLASGFVAVAGLALGEAHLGDLSGQAAYGNRTFRIDELRLDLPRGAIEGRAEVGPNAGRAEAAAGDSAAQGGFEAHLALADVALDSMQALPPGLEVHASGTARLSGDALDLEGLTGTLDLTRLGLQSPRYRVANKRPARLVLRGGYLASDSLAFAVSELPIRSIATPDSGAAAAESGDEAAAGPAPVQLDTIEVGQVLVAGNTAAAPGLQLVARGLGLEALSRLAGSRRQVEGLVDADLSILGPVSRPRVRAQWSMAAGSVDSLAVEDMRGQGTYANGDLSLDRFEMTLAGGRVRAAGRLPLGAGRADSALALNLSLQGVDLAGFRRLSDVEADDIESLTGRLSGELHLAGTRAHPTPGGKVQIQGGELVLRGLRPAFGLRAAELEFARDSVRVSGVRARDGSWEVEARAALHGLTPRWFTASARVRELDVEVLETMEFTATGELTWGGTPDSSALTGALSIPRGQITEPMSLRTLSFTGSSTGADTLSSAWGEGEEGTARVALDVRLAGRDLRLRNDLVDVPFEGEMALSGTADRPVLAGEIRGLGGTLNYLEHVFSLEPGAVRFNNPAPLPGVDALFHDPRAVDPEVRLRGRTELTAKNGNEYEIALALAGRVSDLEFALESDPKREQMDVLSLLAFGKEGVPMMDETGISLQRRSSLSPSYLLSATEDQFGRVLGLDDVSIDSSVLRPGRLSGSRIVLTKQLSNKMEMTYSTSVGYAAQGRVQLQYDLGRNLYLQTEHDAQGESGLDLNLKLRFK